jgi:hypothetical protein
MTLTIDFSPATLERLKADAEATGKDLQTVVRETGEAKYARRRQTLAEILKPIHDETEASGIGEKELDELVDQAVADARADRKASRKQQ